MYEIYRLGKAKTHKEWTSLSGRTSSVDLNVRNTTKYGKLSPKAVSPLHQHTKL